MTLNYSLAQNFYIDGSWRSPHSNSQQDVVDPSTNSVIGRVALGDAHDINDAVLAARRAFASFSRTSRSERLDLLTSIADALTHRTQELADAMVAEVGIPTTLASGAQVKLGIAVVEQARATLEHFTFEQRQGTTLLVHEPIGVCGLITAWNWPVFLSCLKVMPALAAGCTVVLKPSENAPLTAAVFAQALHEAGVPSGVFNLVQGAGPNAGAALVAHEGVDMISFTGSTRAGAEVARAAAPTIKRVVQELGGKSANVLLPDADFPKAVRAGVMHCFNNSGQTCVAPSRMLVPAERLEEAAQIAREVSDTLLVGNPRELDTQIGPVASVAQYDRVQEFIASGLEEGAALAAGGPGRPAHLQTGCYVRPTVFTKVHNRMRIAREEIFGPILCLIPYRDVDEAVAIANDSSYGLAAYVQGADAHRVRAVARRLRVGSINLNGAAGDPSAPIGGYRQSGNGREKGEHGLREFLEVKSLVGFGNDGEEALS